MSTHEKLFESDVLTKRERVERTLNLLPVDRVAIHDQLSHNAGVISLYTGKAITGFNYSYEDVCTVIRKTLDACFPPRAPIGTARVTDADGFVIQHDNWNSWTVSRPFTDVAGAREYLVRKTHEMRRARFDAQAERERFHDRMVALQHVVGDTVIIDTSTHDGFDRCWTQLGLELFAYLYDESPDVISDYIEAVTDQRIHWVHAVADPALSPVVLHADDFGSKEGPIFSPAMLRKEHFPHVQRLTEAWHSHGLKVLYHSDGNWKRVIPDLIATGVDGFYCLEPAVGMDIVELKKTWPEHVWAGGVDGVDLMERGTPQQVTEAVRRQIIETDALHTGGMFVGSSSEINPPIKPENFQAMIEAVHATRNPAEIPLRKYP